MSRPLLVLVLVTALLAAIAATHPGKKAASTCVKGECTSDSGVLDYWKLPQPYGDCSRSGPKKATEPWCVAYWVVVKECCRMCKNTMRTTDGKPFNCRHWVIVPVPKSLGTTWEGGERILLPAVDSLTPSRGSKGRCTTSGKMRVGKECPTGVNDPHFVGAHGTHFDFNGLPHRSFCLYTDRHLHLSMAMRGYLDHRPLPPASAAAGNHSALAAARFVNGSAVRTWIRQLALMWHDDDNEGNSTGSSAGNSTGNGTWAGGAGGARVTHSLVLTARDGKEQARGSEGFLASASLDNVTLPRLMLGQSHIPSNGRLNLSFVGQEKTGPYDVDVYSLRLAGLLELDLRLRAAHPLLQTPEDAQVMFVDASASSDVHGVMGQTYRGGREPRSMELSRLATLLHHPVAADGEDGRGFLDGQVADYQTSDVASTDCAFSAFNGRPMPLGTE